MNGEVLCNCSKCHQWFNYNDLQIKETRVAGIQMNVKTCPYCESSGWTTKDDEEWFDKYDTNKYLKRYYEY